MIKSGIFLGLYAAVGIAGWTAYDMLNGKEPVLSEMGISGAAVEQVSSLLSPKQSSSNTLYRWQDANGQWHYGSKPPAGANSEELNYNPSAELEQLKRLPSNVLPTGGQTVTAVNDDGSGFMFPGIPDMKEVAKLIKQATDMQSKADERKAQIDAMIE